MKFPKVKRCRANTLKGMIQILDKVFSEYIRRRDAGGREYVRCVTCSTVKHWKEMDCGHFVSRNHLSIRFDDRNAHAQCPMCNRFKGGEQYLHGVAIDKKHGTGTASLLQAISRVSAGIDTTWLQHHIELYRRKIKEIKNKC